MGYRARIEEFRVDPKAVKERLKNGQDDHGIVSLIGNLPNDPKNWRRKTDRRGDPIDYLKFMVGFYEVDLGRHKYGSILFTGCDQMREGYGNEFLVVDGIGCSPSADWSLGLLSGGTDIFVNLYVNTSHIFYDPAEGLPVPGVSGLVAPYPESDKVHRQFAMDPEIYVLPGQSWGLKLSYHNIEFSDACPEKNLRAFVRYTLYDGCDAKIALKLLDMGISVKPQNIDWYRRLSKEHIELGASDKIADKLDGKDPKVVYSAKKAKRTVKKSKKA